MSCEYVFRDISDIYSRLFSHRAALHGLTNNFVKEFEEKRGEREMISLSRTQELVTDCRDRALPATFEHLKQYLSPLQESVDKTKHLCQKILQDAEEKKGDWLQTEQARRDEEWKEFMAAQVIRSKRVDDEFESKTQSLTQHYTELEKKLKEEGGKFL